MTRTKKRAGTILRKFDRVNNLGRIKPSASRHLNTEFSPGFQSCMPGRHGVSVTSRMFQWLVFTSTLVT